MTTVKSMSPQGQQFKPDVNYNSFMLKTTQFGVFSNKLTAFRICSSIKIITA